MTDHELREKIDAIERAPALIAAAATGVDDRTLRYKPAPDKWCILEILGHLADIEVLYGYRMRQMMADREPTLAPIDQDDWARNLGYMEGAPSDFLDRLPDRAPRQCPPVAAAEGRRPAEGSIPSRKGPQGDARRTAWDDVRARSQSRRAD